MPEAFSGALGTEQFLNLFVTQLQYQDPLSPMDQTDSLTLKTELCRWSSTTRTAAMLELLSAGLSTSSTRRMVILIAVTATPASSRGGSHVLSIWSKLQPEREAQHGGLIPSDQTCGPRAARP